MKEWKPCSLLYYLFSSFGGDYFWRLVNSRVISFIEIPNIVGFEFVFSHQRCKIIIKLHYYWLIETCSSRLACCFWFSNWNGFVALNEPWTPIFGRSLSFFSKYLELWCCSWLQKSRRFPVFLLCLSHDWRGSNPSNNQQVRSQKTLAIFELSVGGVSL